ncbi:hypothetical protein [Streptomyces boncukensis]|uniref:Uncharacterized protein n=1 Tax=Streptomyces boncukensis TaxID=2711219 RepID=A0A6G4X065_9ACTN|nr:hypothetical protein [Streptomyces boncukensis]NGO70280.1 hypothetical protein [Streptomyces boncukensis]
MSGSRTEHRPDAVLISVVHGGIARDHGGTLTASSPGTGQGARCLVSLPSARPAP